MRYFCQTTPHTRLRKHDTTHELEPYRRERTKPPLIAPKMSAGVITPPRPRTPRISRMGGEISKKCRRVFVSPPSRLARQRGHLPDISASRSDADCSMDDSNDLLEPIQAPEVSPNAPSRHNLRYRRIVHQSHVSDEREALKRSKLSRKGSK